MSARFSYTLIAALGFAACAPTHAPEMRVVGIETQKQEVVFLRVTNPAAHTMRITKLQYTFAADGKRLSSGDVRFSRDVGPGAAAILEVPYDPTGEPTLLRGQLTTESDQMVRTFSVSTQIPAH